MLYKASTTPALDARKPNKTARQHIAKVARDLGAGSTPRAILAFAKTDPKAFWTQLYARTIEKEVSVTHEAGDSLTALLAQSYGASIEGAETLPIVEGQPVQVIAAPTEDI